MAARRPASAAPRGPAAPLPTRGGQGLHPAVSLVLWVIGVQLVGLAGAAVPPGAWYAQLAKPPWTPPSAVFAPAWITLYGLIAISAWLVWRQRPLTTGQRRQRTTALTWTAIHLLLNALWTPLFFGAHLLALALADLTLLVAAVALTTVFVTRVHCVAGMLLLPYLLWVAFAWSLNAGIWWLNR
jgi:tryptophan-rich sensory protein